MSSTKRRTKWHGRDDDHIYERYDGRYELGLRLTDSTGTKKLRWIGPFDTVQLARDERDKLKGDKLKPVAANPRLTFNQAADAWWENSVLVHRQGQTIPTYAGHLKHLRKAFGPSKLKEIRVEQIRPYLRGLDCAEFTKHGRLSVLSAVFGYAISYLGHDHNPCKLLHRDERPKSEAERQHYILTPAETEAVITGDAFLTLVRRTGLRKGEALGLIPEDLDLQAGFLTVSAQRNRQGGRSEPKTKNSNRTIPIDHDTCRILRRHMMANPGEWVFGFSHSGADRRLTRACEREGITGCSMHDLRHTHASELIAAGWDVVRVAKRLGDTVQTVSKVYAHAFDRARHAERERDELAALWAGNAVESLQASSGASGNVLRLANHR